MTKGDRYRAMYDLKFAYWIISDWIKCLVLSGGGWTNFSAFWVPTSYTLICLGVKSGEQRCLEVSDLSQALLLQRAVYHVVGKGSKSRWPRLSILSGLQFLHLRRLLHYSIELSLEHNVFLIIVVVI